MSAGQSSGDRLEKWASLTPWLVICYFAVQLCVRLAIASPLEVDDAEMVGQIDWALGYPNSHPPLYHWLVRICYDLFHSWPAATALPKYALLAAAYLFIYHTARRASGFAVTGAVAVAFLFFIPVVCWKTQIKLTHSILGFAATGALLHALMCVLLRPGWKAYVWLGCAIAAGLLAKYNFPLVLLAAAIAVMLVREGRRSFQRPAASLAILIPFVLTLPHLIWIRQHSHLTTENLYRFQITGGPLGLNLKATSVWDGLLSLFLVTLVSAGPMGLVGLATTLLFRREYRTDGGGELEMEKVMRRILGWMLLCEFMIFVVTVFVGGFSQVHERYLLVLLPPLPLWAALWWRPDARPKGSTMILSLAVGLAIIITAGTAAVRVKEKHNRTQAIQSAFNPGVVKPVP